MLEIVNHPTNPAFAQQKADLIYAMKSACLEGLQLASYLTVSASLLGAVAVAALLPWKPAGDSVLLVRRERPSK
ncbi:hypothetical protein [Rhodococcus jostii]|uniref:hypothetical protein n=1 Tax=Rhodococcus jostii TaxID=132919 RepID=UPI0009349716|nr:hypothetical protein [Rhodococcus jostii]